MAMFGNLLGLFGAQALPFGAAGAALGVNANKHPWNMGGDNFPGISPRTTPGFGDGIEGNQRIDGTSNVNTSAPADLFAGQRSMMASPAPLDPVPPGAPTIRPAAIADQPIPLKPINAADLAQNPHTKGPGFFDKDGAWRYIAGGLLDGVATHFGGQPGFAPALQQAQRSKLEQDRWMAQYAAKRKDDLADREHDENKAQYFSGNEDRVKFDPTTGQSTTIYDAPMPAEAYAKGLGYEPNTPEYNRAMEDYTLRGWSGTALGNRMALDDYRTGNRQEVKGSPTYRDLHPRPTAPRPSRAPTTSNVIAGVLSKVAGGVTLSAGEQQIYDTYRNGRRGRGRYVTSSSGVPGSLSGVDPRAYEGKTVRDSATGARLTARNGKWVPAL